MNSEINVTLNCENDFLKRLGVSIKIHRLRERITQEELCERVSLAENGRESISQGWISKVEKGDANMTVTVLFAICRSLNVAPSTVLFAAEHAGVKSTNAEPSKFVSCLKNSNLGVDGEVVDEIEEIVCRSTRANDLEGLDNVISQAETSIVVGDDESLSHELKVLVAQAIESGNSECARVATMFERFRKLRSHSESLTSRGDFHRAGNYNI